MDNGVQDERLLGEKLALQLPLRFVFLIETTATYGFLFWTSSRFVNPFLTFVSLQLKKGL